MIKKLKKKNGIIKRNEDVDEIKRRKTLTPLVKHIH